VRDRRRRNGRTGAARLERRFPRLINGATDSSRGNGSDNLAHTAVEQYRRDCPDTLLEKPIDCARLLTHTFLRLANLESGAFGLLNRYGLALWRQTVQTIIALRAVRQMVDPRSTRFVTFHLVKPARPSSRASLLPCG